MPALHWPRIAPSAAFGDSPTMKRWAMCRTPAAAAAPSAFCATRKTLLRALCGVGPEHARARAWAAAPLRRGRRGGRLGGDRLAVSGRGARLERADLLRGGAPLRPRPGDRARARDLAR